MRGYQGLWERWAVGLSIHGILWGRRGTWLGSFAWGTDRWVEEGW